MEIPGYTVVRELSKGGMATVYLAVQDRLNRQVALKVIEPALEGDENFAERFIKEGRIALQLKHPNIITLYDFNSHGPYYYFSMEFLAGGTLSEQIETGLTTERALIIIQQIAKALAYAHQFGIIHRDIKPRNILFRQDGTPILSDFGIAKMMDAEATQLTASGIVMGSPRYMSPEQISGKTLDARSDLYSLGVVIYEMLTQRTPYHSGDVISLALMHCSEPAPKLPSDFSKFQPILDKLLAKDPVDRFDSAEQLIDAIDRIESSQFPDLRSVDRSPPVFPLITAAPKMLITPSVRSGTVRSKTVLVVSSLLMLTLIIMTGVYLISVLPSPSPDSEINTTPPPALEDRSAAAVYYERLATENFQRGELESSLELISLGLNAAPNDNGLLALRNRIKNYQQAIQLLAKARELQQQGTLDESLKLIEQGLQLVPEQPDLLKLRDQLEVRAKLEQIANQYADWANDALAQGDLKKAEDYLAQLSQVKPDHPRLSILKRELQAKREPVTTAIQRQMEETPRQQMDEELKWRMEAEVKRKTEEEVKQQAVEEAKRKAAERARRQVAEQPKQQTATPDTGGNNHRRCGDILSRLTLGEPVPDEDRTFLRRCR